MRVSSLVSMPEDLWIFYHKTGKDDKDGWLSKGDRHEYHFIFKSALVLVVYYDESEEVRLDVESFQHQDSELNLMRFNSHDYSVVDERGVVKNFIPNVVDYKGVVEFFKRDHNSFQQTHEIPQWLSLIILPFQKYVLPPLSKSILFLEGNVKPFRQLSRKESKE